MNLENVKATFLVSGEGGILELYDSDASVMFARVTFTPEQVCQMLGRLSHTNCQKAEVFALDKVGKKHESRKFEFELPDHMQGYGIKESELHEIALLNCPEDWTPDKYYGSRDSFFTRDGKKWARVTIRRWVEKNLG